MALSSEDKADVKGALGKAMANKIERVTRDRFNKNPFAAKYKAKLSAKPTKSSHSDGAMRGKALAKAYEAHRGQEQKKYEMAANPDMHAFKNSMRRKGFDSGKIFSGALRQAERYNKGVSGGYTPHSLESKHGRGHSIKEAERYNDRQAKDPIEQSKRYRQK